MNTKQCSTCRVQLPHTAFHRNRSQPDGFANQCKACFEIAHKRYRTSEKGKQTIARQRGQPGHRPAMRIYQHTYNHSAKGKAADTRYEKSDKGKATAEAERQRNLPHAQARLKVLGAIRRGALPRAKTQICACGQPATQWHHHHGYAEPYWLDVIPVCQLCHTKAHNS